MVRVLVKKIGPYHIPVQEMALVIRGRGYLGSGSSTWCDSCYEEIDLGEQYVYEKETTYRYCLGCVIWISIRNNKLNQGKNNET